MSRRDRPVLATASVAVHRADNGKVVLTTPNDSVMLTRKQASELAGAVQEELLVYVEDD